MKDSDSLKYERGKIKIKLKTFNFVETGALDGLITRSFNVLRVLDEVNVFDKDSRKDLAQQLIDALIKDSEGFEDVLEKYKVQNQLDQDNILELENKNFALRSQLIEKEKECKKSVQSEISALKAQVFEEQWMKDTVLKKYNKLQDEFDKVKATVTSNCPVEIQQNLCSMTCIANVNWYRSQIDKLVQELDILKIRNGDFQKQEKKVKDKLEENRIAIHDLEATLGLSKITQEGYEKMIFELKAELAKTKLHVEESEIKLLESNLKLSKFQDSSNKLTSIFYSQNNRKGKEGIGFHQVPPPFGYSQVPYGEDEIKFRDFTPSESYVTDPSSSDISDFENSNSFKSCAESDRFAGGSVERKDCVGDVVLLEELSDDEGVIKEKPGFVPENYIITNEYNVAFQEGKTIADANAKILQDFAKCIDVPSTSNTPSTSISKLQPEKDTNDSNDKSFFKQTTQFKQGFQKKFQKIAFVKSETLHGDTLKLQKSNDVFLKKKFKANDSCVMSAIPCFRDKVCFRCGNKGHIARHCGCKSEDKASKWKHMSKHVKMTKGSSRVSNVLFAHTPPVKHRNMFKSFVLGFKQHVVSTMKPFQNKWLPPKHVWREKPKVETIINEAKDLMLQEVTYIDLKGQTRTTMAWVPLSN